MIICRWWRSQVEQRTGIWRIWQVQRQSFGPLLQLFCDYAEDYFMNHDIKILRSLLTNHCYNSIYNDRLGARNREVFRFSVGWAGTDNAKCFSTCYRKPHQGAQNQKNGRASPHGWAKSFPRKRTRNLQALLGSVIYIYTYDANWGWDVWKQMPFPKASFCWGDGGWSCMAREIIEVYIQIIYT